MVAGAVGKAAGGVLLTLTVSNYSLVFLVAFALSAFPLYVVVRHVKGLESSDLATEKDTAAKGSEHPAGESPRGAGRSAIMSSFGFGVLTTGTAAMLNNLFPLLATQYAGLTEAEAGIVYAVSVLVIIFAGPLFGWLSDNVSRKLVLSARGIANTVSSVLYITFPGFVGVTTAKIIDDTGKAAFRPAWGTLMARISSLDRARRAQLIGYMSLAENIGETGGPLLAGFLWNTWGAVVMLAVRAVLSVITEIYALLVMKSIAQVGETVAPDSAQEAIRGAEGVPAAEDSTNHTREGRL